MIRPNAKQTGWHLDLGELERHIRPETRLLVLNFPHNPTGYMPDRKMLEGILEVARRHRLVVFSDEMYRGLELDPAQRLPALCDVFVVPDWLRIKDFITICHSAPREILGLIAVRARDELFARNLTLVRENLRRAEAYFAGVPELFRWLAPQATSVAFPAWTGPGSIEALCETALERAAVMVVPARTA